MTVPDSPSARPELLHVVASHVQESGDTLSVASPDLLDAVLHHLGPAATLLWMHLAHEWCRGRDPVNIAELARWSGLKPAMVWHALDRLAKWGPAEFVATDTIIIPLYTDPRRWRQRTSRPATEVVS